MSEDAAARARIRDLFLRAARFRSRVLAGKEEEGIKYRDYHDWEEPVAKAPSHRILAVRRGEKEGFFLMMRMYQPEEKMYRGEYILPPLQEVK